MAKVKILTKVGEIITVDVQETVEMVWVLMCGTESEDDFYERKRRTRNDDFFVKLMDKKGKPIIIQKRYFFMVEED